MSVFNNDADRHGTYDDETGPRYGPIGTGTEEPLSLDELRQRNAILGAAIDAHLAGLEQRR